MSLLYKRSLDHHELGLLRETLVDTNLFSDTDISHCYNPRKKTMKNVQTISSISLSTNKSDKKTDIQSISFGDLEKVAGELKSHSQTNMLDSLHENITLALATNESKNCFNDIYFKKDIRSSKSLFNLNFNNLSKESSLKSLKKENRRYSLDTQPPCNKESFRIKSGLSSFALPSLSDLSKRRYSYSGTKSSMSNLLLEHRLETPARKIHSVDGTDGRKETKVHEHRKYFSCKKKESIRNLNFDESTKSDEENKEPSISLSSKYNLPIKRIDRSARRHKSRVSDAQIINRSSILVQVVKMQLKRTSDMCQNVLPTKRHIRQDDEQSDISTTFIDPTTSNNSTASNNSTTATKSSQEPISSVGLKSIRQSMPAMNTLSPNAFNLDGNDNDEYNDNYNEQKMLKNDNDSSYNMLSSSLSNLKISSDDQEELQQLPSPPSIFQTKESHPNSPPSLTDTNEEPLIILTMAISYYNEREVESLTYVNTLLNRQRLAKIAPPELFVDDAGDTNNGTNVATNNDVPLKPPSKLKWKGNLVHVHENDDEDTNSPSKKHKDEKKSQNQVNTPLKRNIKSIINLKSPKSAFNLSKEDIPTVILQKSRKVSQQ